MMSLVIVSYGEQVGYHHGAKYQILSAYDKWLRHLPSESLVVATDRPELFESYPCEIQEITESEKFKWSLNDQQHFGIKLNAFRRAMSKSKFKNSVLLDTDMYWRRDPMKLENLIDDDTVVMYRSEGKILGNRNKSIKRFEEGLSNRSVPMPTAPDYRLGPDSEMWASNIIGIANKNIKILHYAFELFSKLEPLVDAHTVEQFSLSEAIRISKLSRATGKPYVGSWSSIGKKEFVTPELEKFFLQHGENDFNAHLLYWKTISTRRSAKVFLQQKIRRLMAK